MAERSFANEVQHLRIGKGETFRGEGILAITKALLENGVGYVAGYQGSPISHLMDVLADAQDILAETAGGAGRGRAGRWCADQLDCRSQDPRLAAYPMAALCM